MKLINIVLAALITGFPVIDIPVVNRGYAFPVGGYEAILDFFNPVPPGTEYRSRDGYHRGLNINASFEEVIMAPGAGVVTFAGPVYGNYTVSIEHPDGLISSLQPVLPLVSVGEAVGVGTPIGTLDNWRAYETRDSSHCPGDTCLYWGVRRGEERYVNPLWLLGLAAPIVLLPAR